MPTLYEQLEDLGVNVEKDTFEAEASEEKDPSEEVSEEEESSKEKETEEKQEEKAEADKDAPAQEEKAEEQSEQPKSLDAAAFAKLRADANKARREKERLEAELAAVKAAQSAPVKQADAKQEDSDPEPDKSNNFEGWLEWKNRQIEKKAAAIENKTKELSNKLESQEREKQAVAQEQNAVKAIGQYEAEFRSSAPDYDDVSAHFMRSIVASYKALNPGADDEMISDAVKKHVIQTARRALDMGYENPVEFMYNYTKQNLGYAPQQKQAEQKQSGPDLKKVVDNRKKSGSPVAAGGKSGNQPLSRESLLKGGMTVGEFSRLDPNKIRQLEGVG